MLGKREKKIKFSTTFSESVHATIILPSVSSTPFFVLRLETPLLTCFLPDCRSCRDTCSFVSPLSSCVAAAPAKPCTRQQARQSIRFAWEKKVEMKTHLSSSSSSSSLEQNRQTGSSSSDLTDSEDCHYFFMTMLLEK